MPKHITVYTKPNCMQCNFTKNYLTEHRIPFDQKDITKDAEALNFIKTLGYQAVPVVYIDKDTHWYGFSPDKLAELGS